MRRLIGLLALAACGDGVPGPDTEGAVDANVGLVRVILPGHREAEVFFQNADSTLVLATHSDGEGEANAYMAPGGFVTLVSRDTFNTTLYTWAGVEGGDVLELLRDAPPHEPSFVSFSIPPEPSAFFYQLSSACGVHSISGAEVEPISILLDRCPTSTVSMLVQAFGDTSRFLYRDAVSIDHDPTIVFQGPYLERQRLAVRAIDLPPLASSLVVQAALVGSGVEVYADQTPIAGPLPGTTASAEIEMPLPATAMLAVQVGTRPQSGAGASLATVWGPVASAVTVAFGAPLRHYTSKPQYIAAEHAIRWTEDETGRVADGVIVSLPWQHTGTGEGLVWRVLAPRSADPVVRLPVLPPAELRPGAGDLVFDPTVLTSFSVTGGYASVRPYLLGTYDQVSTWPVRGDSGHVEAETLAP